MVDSQNKDQVKPSGSLIRDWWEELYPRAFINTFIGYFKNHRRFFDEIFNEQWDNKVKPIAFFFTCVTLVFLAGSISPYENPFELLPTWSNVYSTLTETEMNEFKAAFEIPNYAQFQSDSVQMGQQVQLLTGVTEPPVTAKHLKTYFEQNGRLFLAQRADYQILKFKEAMAFGNLEFTFLINLALLYFVIWWRVSHRFLKKPERTPRETIYVYMYNMSMILLFVYVPFIFLAGSSNEYFVFIPIIALIVILIKGVRVFRYTHDAGFFRLMGASIKTNLVIMTLFIPLIFLSSKPEQPKSEPQLA